MTKLSKPVEEKLMRAVEATATHVSAGLHPNDAIVKAANDLGVHESHIGPIVRAYNTGRTTLQRVSHTDVWDKAADFELADEETVRGRLLSGTKSAAARGPRSTEVSTDYGMSPTGVLERRRSAEKQARAIDWTMVPPPAPLPRDQHSLARKAVGQVERTKHALEEIRRQGSAELDKAAAAVAELADYFRSPTSTPLPVVRENVVLLHGGRGERVMDQLIEWAPGISKLARHKTAAPHSLPAATGRPYELVTAVLGHIDTYNHLQRTLTEKTAAARSQAEVLLAPFVERVHGPSVLDSLPTEKAAFGGLLNAAGQMSLFKNIADGAQAPDESALVRNQIHELSDPEHETQLQNIRSQTMLSDLMQNDETLASHPQDEVLDAYNDIVEMAPRAADKRVAMQSLLRKRLSQGALDPFEVDQMLNIEKRLRDNRDPQQIPVGVNADGSVLNHVG